MKGEETILQDIYNVVQPFLQGKISGDTYIADCRPLNSTKEDAVIRINSVGAEQVQEGRAAIAIYTKDIDCGIGRLVRNRGRLAEFEALTEDIVSLLNDADTSYLWELSSAPLVIPDSTQEHALNINLRFRLTNY